ncbi:hypothetical protein FQR65_LT07009 [Abscondita terminalis]|nr:hypothetical protein FQR65_LT07009 [Abscondita terminalis]
MTLCFCLVDGSRLYKKHVMNSVVPSSSREPGYNITSWAKQLHLQQCVLVEIGDKYCGIYVEFRQLTLQVGIEIQEYFLGLCDSDTIRKWKFCSADLEKERPYECVFKENTLFSDHPSRVHRRLCDVTGLAFHGDMCDCNQEIDGRKLLRVAGFPTCFLPPLPDSLCIPRNVCGVARCNASTVNQQVHTVRCNPNCIGAQPFCETPGLLTSRASKIESFWTDWSEDLYDDVSEPNGYVHTEAMCINKNTGMGAIDCLGPGTNCCPDNTDECKCYIYIEDGILKLFRKYKVKKTPKKYVNYFKNLIEPRRIFKRNNKQTSLWNGFYYRKRDEEVYEDDNENEDDANDEDIVLEETGDEVDATTKASDDDENEKIGELGLDNTVTSNDQEVFKPQMSKTNTFHMQNLHSTWLKVVILLLRFMWRL